MTSELLFEQGAMMVINDDAGQVAVFEIDITKLEEALRELDDWAPRHNLDLAVAKKELAAFLDTEKLLSEIARKTLMVPTLKSRNMDSLDFHEVGVASLRDALLQAYAAGRNSASKRK